MFPIGYRMKSGYVKTSPSEVVASAILWEQIPDALRAHAMPCFTLIGYAEGGKITTKTHDAFEVIDDSFSDLLKRVLSWLDFFLAYY